MVAVGPDLSFDQLKAAWTWRPLRNCPGRFVLQHGSHPPSLQDLLGENALVASFRVAGAKDTVWVVPISGGGLISYAKSSGSFVHTLNTREGFKRKLAQLGIKLDARGAK